MCVERFWILLYQLQRSNSEQCQHTNAGRLFLGKRYAKKERGIAYEVILKLP